MMNVIKQGTKRELAISLAWMICLGFMTFLLNLYWDPSFTYNRFLKADRSVFAVAGKLINEGKLPYRDFWDHKPPAIFYLDAAILRLFGTSLWSFWWSNIIWLVLTAVILFLFLRKLSGTLPAVLASGVFLVTFMDPNYFGGGNLPETYAGLPQVLIFVATYYLFSTGRRIWACTAGFLTAVAFLFKQTCIAPGIGAALACIWLGIQTRSFRKALVHLVWFLLGVMIPLGLILAIWAAAGAFGDLWGAIVVYNLLYVGGGLSFASIATTFRRLFVELPFMPVTIIILGSLAVFLINNRRWMFHFSAAKESVQAAIPGEQEIARQYTFLSVFISLPFAIALVTAGGLNIPHYYNALVPVLAIACTCLFEQLVKPVFFKPGYDLVRVISILVLVILGGVWLVNAYRAEKPKAGVRYSLSLPLYGPLPQSDLAVFVLNHTQPGDPILIWGNNIELYLFTDRRDPSRYLYPQPLFEADNGPVSRFDQFLEDIQRDPPELIIQPISAEIPLISVPDDQLCQSCDPGAARGMRQFKSYVTAHYTIVSEDPSMVIYQHVH